MIVNDCDITCGSVQLDRSADQLVQTTGSAVMLIHLPHLVK